MDDTSAGGALCHVNLARGFRGGERQTELLVRELAERGLSQRIVLRDGEPLATRLADVPGLTRIPTGKPFAWHAWRVRGMFLHAHDGKGAHFAHAAHVLAGCDYLITRRVDNRPSGSWLTRRMYCKARKVVVLSEAIGGVMRAHLPGLATVRIPSAAGGLAVDAANAAALRREFGGECVVGQVGALDDSQKGQHDTIAAARRLYAEDKGWRFVFVGGGRDEAALREAAAGCEAIRFIGHVDNVGDYLAAFDLFAFPSVHEGLGSTLLDAMHAALPIVASRVDGIPEIVTDERTGLLVPPRDPEALAAALARLRSDPDRAQRLAAAGKDRALAYTPRAMADRYVALYRALGVAVDQRTSPDAAAAGREDSP